MTVLVACVLIGTVYTLNTVVAMVSGSNTSKKVIWPLLLGIGGFLILVWLVGKDENKRVCSRVPAAVLVSNSSLKRSYEIEKAKKKCIEEKICRPGDLVGYSPCEFTAYDLKECKDIDPSLADYKTAKRHLEAEVETCDLQGSGSSRTNSLPMGRERA